MSINAGGAETQAENDWSNKDNLDQTSTHENSVPPVPTAPTQAPAQPEACDNSWQGNAQQPDVRHGDDQQVGDSQVGDSQAGGWQAGIWQSADRRADYQSLSWAQSKHGD